MNLRERCFALFPIELKLIATETRQYVWAALMDMALANGVATVVAVGDGSRQLTSLSSLDARRFGVDHPTRVRRVVPQRLVVKLMAALRQKRATTADSLL